MSERPVKLSSGDKMLAFLFPGKPKEPVCRICNGMERWDSDIPCYCIAQKEGKR